MEPQPASHLSLDALLAEAGWLRSLARSLVSDPAAADDLVQETWLAALKHPPAADRPLRPWLRTVVENFARMRLRGDGARTRREQARASDEEHAGEQELVERVEEQRFLAREVLRLEEPFRSCLVLRYYEGLSSEQIAARTASNENTVRWRMKRALEMLRERLDRRHSGDRSAWLSLLAPLTLPPVEVARVGPPAAAGATSLAAWVVACAVALIGAVWWSATRTPITPVPANRTGAVLTADATSPGFASAADPDRRAAPQSAVEALARARGRVVDTQGAPIAGARIALLAREELAGLADLEQLSSRKIAGVAHARSAADGTFELQLAHSLRANASDVAAVEADGCLRAWAQAPLEFVDEFQLGELRLAREARLSGAVTDESGRPLHSARVAVERVGSRWPAERVPPLEEARRLGSLLDPSAPSAASDTRGAFEIGALAEGYWRVWASAEGRESAWAGPFALSAGARFEVPTIALPLLERARCVRGSVVDARGAPVAGAEVEGARSSLQRAFFVERSGVQRTRTDREGRFVLAAEAGGAYQLAARAGELLAQLDWNVGDGRDARLVLRKSPTLRVNFAGVAHEPHAASESVEIELRDALDGQLLSSSTPSCDGRGVELALDHWRAVTLEVLHGEAAGRSEAFELDGDALELALALERLPRVRVNVLANGLAVAGARVELLRVALAPSTVKPTGSHGASALIEVEATDPAHAAVATDSVGRVELRPRRPGVYFARVEAAGWPSTLSGPLELDADRELELELRPGGALEGVVRRDAPGEVAGAVVHAVRSDGLEHSFRVGVDGFYRFDALAPGRWQVRLGLSLAMPRAPLLRAANQAPNDEVEVRSGAVVRHDLAFPAAPRCVLSGRALLDGEALGPCVVELVRPGKQRVLARSWSAPDGAFELALDEPGEYELRVDSLDPSGARYEVRQLVRLGLGETRSELAAASATHAVTLRSAPTEPTDFVVRVETEAGATWLVRAAIDGDGRAHLLAPAGATRSAVGELDADSPLTSTEAGRVYERSD